MSMITLYHGTSLMAARGIAAEGFYPGPVYLSPRVEVARDYAYQGDRDEDLAVVVVRVQYDGLNIDNEGYDGQDLEEALREGVSMWADAGAVAVVQVNQFRMG